LIQNENLISYLEQRQMPKEVQDIREVSLNVRTAVEGLGPARFDGAAVETLLLLEVNRRRRWRTLERLAEESARQLAGEHWHMIYYAAWSLFLGALKIGGPGPRSAHSVNLQVMTEGAADAR
jgi:hypothetical protein